MARFDHLVLVCTNDRDPADPRGSCKARGGEELLDRLKALTAEKGLKGKVRAVKTGCLDLCAKGCVAAVYSAEGKAAARETWYTKLEPRDADRLFQRHCVEGKALESNVERSE